MLRIENIHAVKPKDKKLSETHAKAHGRLDKPMRMLPRGHRLERLPVASGAERAKDHSVHIIENREGGSFEAEFFFRLTGVVLNGRFPTFSDRTSKGVGTTGDQLMSRMLPLLDGNSNLEFTFGGGSETSFEWSLQGIIQNAESKEAALSSALILRRDLQMIMASEPCFRFSAEWSTTAERQAKQPCGGWQTRIVPCGIPLRIPAQTTMGFADSTTASFATCARLEGELVCPA
jgi:hypothetical protein